MLDAVGDITLQKNGDHVESGGLVVTAVLQQPGEGGLADLPLLEGGEGQLGDAVGKVAAGFYFDENGGCSIPGDDVHFTPLAAKVSFHHLQAVFLQPGRGQLFPPVPQPLVCMTLVDVSLRYFPQSRE